MGGGGGTGCLWVSNNRLLFSHDIHHPITAKLNEAAQTEQPNRALATVLAQSNFVAPPFIFARAEGRLNGIVYGDVQLQIFGGETESQNATIDGSSADPWAQFDTVPTAVLSSGEASTTEQLWVDCGLVFAQGFRWVIRPQIRVYAPTNPQPESVTKNEATSPTSRPIINPTEQSSNRENVSPNVRPSLIDAFEMKFDATIDAIRFAEIRADNNGDQESKRHPILLAKTLVGEDDHDTAPTKYPKGPEKDVPVGSNTPDEKLDVTIDLPSGQVMLEHLHAERPMVEVLLCMRCENPNPPSSLRCRSCDSSLTSVTTQIREVPQPVLGVVHLSGNREELLDADLVIGRNPSYLPLRKGQRGVVHGEKDRSVSRRHIELKLEQWKVLAVNLQDGTRTTLKTHEGKRIALVHGLAQQLKSGDTIHYGSAWLRFESEE